MFFSPIVLVSKSSCSTRLITLVRFTNDYTKIVMATAVATALLVYGNLKETESDRTCSSCGSKMHVHGTTAVNLIRSVTDAYVKGGKAHQ